jgi:hypothetical protein
MYTLFIRLIATNMTTQMGDFRMAKRIISFSWIFILGYYFGMQRKPMGEEVLMLMGFSFIVGIAANRVFVKMKRKAQERIVRILGYEVRFAKSQPEQQEEPVQEQPVVKLFRPTTVKEAAAPAAAECDFCQGENEIRLAGQKINCPKCKGISEAKALG